MINNWRSLKKGQHIQLKCGCQGIVKYLVKRGSKDSQGFLLTYTKECGFGKDLEKTYSEGYGPYSNMFNYGMCEDAMPAREVPVPEWWAKVVLRAVMGA